MVITGFKSEPKAELEQTNSRLYNSEAITDEKLIATLKPILLGYLIRKQFSDTDKAIFDSKFTEKNRLMVVAENRCIYPTGENAGDCSLCIVIKENQISVCDLQSEHTVLVDQIEDAWPTLTDTAAKIKNTFAESSCCLLVNRTSGRIITASNSLTTMTGLSENEVIGKEYGQLYRRIQPLLVNKKLSIENINVSDISVSLISIENTKRNSSAMLDNAEDDTHILTDESKTIGLYFNRLNALIEKNYITALAPQSVEKLEAVLEEVCSVSPEFDTNPNKAGLRLLLQSILMAHSSVIKDKTESTITLEIDKSNRPYLMVQSAVLSKPDNLTSAEGWLNTAIDLSDRLGLELSKIKTAKCKIENRLNLNVER